MNSKYIFFLVVASFLVACKVTKPISTEPFVPKVANIDLTHWKVTIPSTNPETGKVNEVSPPEIFDYANVDILKEYMYNDSTDGSIVFYAKPGNTTRNTKYSRSELREQMVSGSNSTNWTFKEGGRMRVTMSVPEISKDRKKEKYEYHKTIIAQIHGRLTNEQRDQIGQKDNNAPPILKIYWQDGAIRVKTKVLKSHRWEDSEILGKDAWGDDDGYNFVSKVHNKKFTLEIIASEGRLEVILNDKEKAVYKDKNMQRWGIFENYFKVGNYLNTRDEGAFAKVKLYELEVSH